MATALTLQVGEYEKQAHAGGMLPTSLAPSVPGPLSSEDPEASGSETAPLVRIHAPNSEEMGSGSVHSGTSGCPSANPTKISSNTRSSSQSHATHEPVVVAGISLDRFTASQQFVICVMGVFGFYGMYAILQEKIFSFKGFEYGLYLTVVQFSIYTIVCKLEVSLRDTSSSTRSKAAERIPDSPPVSSSALSPTPMDLQAAVKNNKIESHDSKVDGPKAPLSAYALIGFISVSTVALSNVALQYLIYPLQVMLKSCKLLPVMFVGALYFRKKYGCFEYIAIILLSLGVFVCSFGGKRFDLSAFSTDWKLCVGLAMMTGALAADAVIGNAQEYVMKKYKSSTSEMILYSKFWGFVYLGTALVLSGKFAESFRFCWQHPQLYLYMVCFSVCGCLGEHFVMALIRRWGALLAVVVTSLRKVLTVILSFIIFPKPLHPTFALGMMLVFAGMFLEAYAKNKAAIDPLLVKYKTLVLNLIRGGHIEAGKKDLNRKSYEMRPRSQSEDGLV